ncbi:MAG: glycine cleavage system protein GcvH [Spirochaetales bacterium]|nr:glycine cleavage system protein GcvH [Spirochaetales bacterium]
MSNVIAELKYTNKHEWIKIEGGKAYIGITDFAQEELGEIVYVELPEIGEIFEADDEIASLESVKAAAAMYNPLSGKVIEVNESLEDAPELVNDDPYKNFIYVLEYSNPSELDELINADAYTAFIESLEE